MTRDEAKELFSKCKSDFIIDKIYDRFENRSCENCKYNKKQDNFMIFCDREMCQDGSKMMWHSFTKDFCCNKWGGMKDLKISKELLSEVLKLEVVKHSLFNKSNSSFNITYMQSEDNLKSSWMPINIYEFVFKCKEWAFSKGYIISSGLTPVLGVSKDGWAEVFSSSTPLDGKLHTFKQLSEPEAVIEACEWILKEQNNDTK